MLEGMLWAVKISVARRAVGVRQLRDRLLDLGGRCLDEHRVVVPVADIGDVDVWQPLLAQRRASVAHVLLVLKAARIAAMSGGDQADGAADSRARHLGQRVGEERMPVAHPDVDRQRRPALPQPLPQPFGLRLRQAGEWRHAAEQLVVMCDFFDALGRNASPAQDVREERSDVSWTLGAAERDQQHCVERA